MLHPVFVHHAQEDDPLQLAHDGDVRVREHTEALFFRVQKSEGLFLELLYEILAGIFVQLRYRGPEIVGLQEDAPVRAQYLLELVQVRYIALLGDDARKVHGKAVGYHVPDAFGDVLPVEHLPALPVYEFPLLVHDVVVLKHGLARLEVAALDLALGTLDGAGNHPLFYGRVLVHAKGFHHALNPLSAEEAHQVVRQRDEELGLARVSLAAGAASELVVYAAALVPLGADDEQAARRDDFFRLGGGDSPVFFQKLAVQPPRFEHGGV